MPRIVEAVRLARDADAVWREIGGFGARSARGIRWWRVWTARVSSQARYVPRKDGSVQTERLREVRPDQRAYRYEMVTTEMPVVDYVAEFQAEDIGDGTSRVRWQAEFHVTSADAVATVSGIRAFLRTGLDALAARYGKAPAARLLGINHVALEVGDLDAALAFYQRIFEFELRGRAGGMAFLDMGDQFLALAEGRSQAPDDKRHFGLVVDDRSGLRARALNAGSEKRKEVMDELAAKGVFSGGRRGGVGGGVGVVQCQSALHPTGVEYFP